MKKLLAILGSITVMASAGSLVVACGSNDNSENNTGSKFVDNGVLDPNGQIKIDAAGLLRWYQKNIGLNSVKQVKEFNQLFSVGLMVEAANPDSKIFYGDSPLWKEPTLETFAGPSNPYGLENFPKKLKEIWGTPGDISSNTVQGAARRAFEKFELDHEGKNSQANVVKELAKQFPFVKRNYESLKNAYINNYLLTDNENGALARLTKMLWTQSSPNIKNDTPNGRALVQSFYRLWSTSTVGSIESDINNAIAGNWDKQEEKKINLINLINATGGTNPNITTATPIKPWIIANIQWADKNTTISKELVHDLLERLATPKDPNSGASINRQFDGSHTVSMHWSYSNKNGNALTGNSTYFDLVDSYPNPDFTNADYALASEEIFGFLTNSQRFGVDQYFINQKPVSLSEIVFKKGGEGDLAVNINGEAFLSGKDVSDNTWLQFYGLYNFLQNYVTGTTPGINTTIPGISQYNFDTIFGNIQPDQANVIKLNWPSSVTNRKDDWDKSFYEAKNDDKLLTLSDTTHSEILRYSVYDFIQANQNKNLATYTLDPNPKTPGSIKENLETTYGFVSTATADRIQKSVDLITDATLKTEVTNGLYAALNLIELINRKTTSSGNTSSSDDQVNNKIYQVLNKQQGIIAFIDTDGLHITKINGYDILNNNDGKHSLKTQTTNVFGSSITDRTAYINEAATFKRLNEYVKGDTNVGLYRYVYQDYDNQIFNSTGSSTDPFINKIVDTTELTKLPRLGVSYQQLNPSVTNDYERFLVNNSILNSTSPALTPFYKFNIFNEVKDYLTVNDKTMDTLSPDNSWITDYIGTVLGFDPKNKAKFVSDLLDNFMKFDDSVDSQEFKVWLSKVLVTNIDHTRNLPQLDFRNNWAKWNKKINDSITDDATKNANLPLMILDWGVKQSHIDNLLTSILFEPYLNAFIEWFIATTWYEQIISVNEIKFSVLNSKLLTEEKGVE